MTSRVIIVAKRSSYAHHVEEEQDPRAKALLMRKDPTVANWLPAHREHTLTIEAVQKALDRLGAHTILLERPHAEFDAADADLVVSIGGDGTLLAASHNVAGVPLLGVNSSPLHSIGFFCAGHRENVERLLEGALAGTLPSLRLTRMKVTVNGRVRSRRILNEALFCHSSPAATSRYLISHAGLVEEHRSSGIWIGPAAGSTAAQRSAGGNVLPLGSRKLQAVVREPYVPDGRRCRLLRFTIAEGASVTLRSKMDDACMYLDGPYRVLPVSLGDTVGFSASNEPLTLLGLASHQRRAWGQKASRPKRT